LPFVVFPSRIVGLLIVQARAKWPNFLHLLHWFGRPEYMIFYAIVSFGEAPSAIDGTRMYLASLVVSWTSTVTIGPAGLLCRSQLPLCPELLRSCQH
jgi:hypothetical protein